MKNLVSITYIDEFGGKALRLIRLRFSRYWPRADDRADYDFAAARIVLGREAFIYYFCHV